MNANHKLRLAVIGCGPRGDEHVRAALATGQYEAAAAAEMDAQRLKAVGDAHGFKFRHDDYRKMLAEQRGKIDVLHLCTQPRLRTHPVMAALEAGVKAIITEKPMALDYSEAVSLVDACQKAGALLVVNHQTRNMKEWIALKEAVTSGKLGQVAMLRSSCYGNLLNQGTHMFDQAWNVLGEPAPKWLLGGIDERIGEASSHPAPRNALALVEYEGGARASFSIGAESPAYPNSPVPWFWCNIEVFGSEGKAEAVLNQGFRHWDRAGQLVNSFESRWDSGQAIAQEQLSRDVAAALRDPAFKHPQRGQSALVSFAMVEATCRSALSRKMVEFPLSPGEDALARWSRLE